MKISLFTEWLRLSRMNKTLKRAKQPLLTVLSVEDRYEGLIYWLSSNTVLDYFEPEIKIIKQGYRETDFMYIIV